MITNKVCLTLNPLTRALSIANEAATLIGESRSTEIELTIPTGYESATWYYQYQINKNAPQLMPALTISDGKVGFPILEQMLTTVGNLYISFYATEGATDTQVIDTLPLKLQIQSTLNGSQAAQAESPNFVASVAALVNTAVSSATAASESAANALEQAGLATTSAVTAASQAGLAAASAAAAVTLVATKVDKMTVVTTDISDTSPYYFPVSPSTRYVLTGNNSAHFYFPSPAINDRIEIFMTEGTANFQDGSNVPLFSDVDASYLGVTTPTLFVFTGIQGEKWMADIYTSNAAGTARKIVATKAYQDGAGNVIPDTYATKTESGLKVDKVDGKSLVADTEIARLALITGTGTGAVDSVAGKTGAVTLVKSDVGLGNVDNTADSAKPVSTAQQTALNLKLDKNTAITGATKTKITYDADGLVTAGADATTADITDSTDKRYCTDAEKTKLTGIAAGAEVNVQSDWNSSSGDSQILNKPTILKKYAGDMPATATSVMTHNLNSSDVVITIRETASPYAVVMADVEMTSVNTVTVRMATAPTAGQYRITIIG